MGAFAINTNSEEVLKSDAFQSAMDQMAAEYNQHISNLAKELGVSEDCANDVAYLRTRSRHTQELENELIRLHAAGTPPNMSEFGVTAVTQNALMQEVEKQLAEKGIKL